VDTVAPDLVDKASYAGHYFSDKAPGLSLLAFPVAFGIHAAAHALGLPTQQFFAGYPTRFFVVCVWASCMLTNSLITAIAAGAIFILARYLRASVDAALFGALCFGLATPAFGWSTVFFGHAIAGGLLFLAFAVTVVAGEPDNPERGDVPSAVAIGLLLAWMFTIEFTTAVAGLLVALLGLRLTMAFAPHRRIRIVIAALAGALVGLVPLAVYNAAAFGSPFHLGYASAVGFEGMQQGLFGIGIPQPAVIYNILLGRYRGIVWVAPVLVAAPFALVAMARRVRTDVAFVVILVPIGFILLNAGYVYWNGGWSTGPRHIVPMLPFIGLALAFLWDAAGRKLRVGLAALALLSMAMSTICASVTMFASEADPDPVFTQLLPGFWNGQVHDLLVLAGVPGWTSYLGVPVVVAVGFLGSRLLPTSGRIGHALEALMQDRTMKREALAP